MAAVVVADLFDLEEAARQLTLRPRTLRKWVAAGKIGCVRLGPGPAAQLRFRPDQIAACLRVFDQKPAAPPKPHRKPPSPRRRRAA